MDVTLTAYPKEEYLLFESKGAIETMEVLLTHSGAVWEKIHNQNFKKS
ncbi:MAG: hypothetical protein ABI325_06720 [Ginsengibacter sp.]